MLMRRIFITGDLHGELDIKKLGSKRWEDGKELTKEDYLIICGDFGLIWKNKPDKNELHWLKWFEEKPWTTLFVDGNHENHVRLNTFPQVDMFGSKVGKINDSVYHLLRGHIYTIHNHTFFCMGGATSTDKHSRIENVSWWKDEEPSKKEWDYAFDNIDKIKKVDYVVTHTAPCSVLEGWAFSDRVNDSVAKGLEEVRNRLKFKKWFFGHMHNNVLVQKKFQCLYNRINEIELGYPTS
jgi:predicted phosphodiesterase